MKSHDCSNIFFSKKFQHCFNYHVGCTNTTQRISQVTCQLDPVHQLPRKSARWCRCVRHDRYCDLPHTQHMKYFVRGHSTTTWTEFYDFFSPPPPAWTVFIPLAWTKTDILDPLPPHLVHVVIEWPLSRKLLNFVPRQTQGAVHKRRQNFLGRF